MTELETFKNLLTEHHVFLIKKIAKQIYGPDPLKDELIVNILDNALLHLYSEFNTPL